MATLAMLDECGETAQRWELGDEPTIVGRSSTVDVRIDDDGMSRRHFAIVRDGAEYLVKDLSSRNGTWVHGHRAVAARLRHNDCILAGRTLFRFYEEAEVAAGVPQLTLGPHGTKIVPLTRFAMAAADGAASRYPEVSGTEMGSA